MTADAAGGKRPRGRGRPPIFTEEVLATIPLWVAAGANRVEIARALGTTKASLSVTCGLHGISLRPGDHGIRRRLGSRRWAVLRSEAALRGTTVFQLLVDIVIAVVDDKLFKAVLGDPDGEDD